MRWTNASIALSHRHAVVPCRLSFSCVRWQSSKAAPESPPTPRPSPSPDRPITHFGFQSIPTEEKESLVRSVFSSVAGSYDTMNDVMSLGIHRLWKDTLITRMGPGPQTRLLDVAGGTGDIAFRFLKAANGKDAVVNVVDINPDMLQVGRNRALQMGFSHGTRISLLA